MGYTTDAEGGKKNWLERLGDKIPGYKGYQAKERRRDIDKLHRDALADRIRRGKAGIGSVIGDLTNAGRLFEIAPMEQISKKLDGIENRVRFATYGYSGFFDVVKIQEDQLDRIYQFDLTLVEKVEAIEAQIAALEAASSDAAKLKPAIKSLEQAVDDLGTTFDGRQQAINGFGSEGAPGRPMFQ